MISISLDHDFFFKLYNIVLVLPNIEMNPPQVYMCSPSWTLLPPPSPYHPSGSSQCTSPKHPVSCIKPGLATRFIYDIIHVSMPFSQIIPPSPSPTESKDCSIHQCLFCCLVMATHSSTLAWKIPWMEEPGRLQSMGSLRVKHDWATSLYFFTFMHWRRKWQLTPVFLPGEFHGQRNLGSQRVRHDWVTNTQVYDAVIWHMYILQNLNKIS